MLKVSSDNSAAGFEAENAKIPDNSEANHRSSDVLNVDGAEVAQPMLDTRTPVADPIEKGVRSAVHMSSKLGGTMRYQILKNARPILKYSKANVNATEIIRTNVQFTPSSVAQSIDLATAIDQVAKLKKLYEVYKVRELTVTYNNNNNLFFAQGTLFLTYNQDPYRDYTDATDIRRNPDCTTIRSGFSKTWRPELTRQWLYSKQAGNKRLYSPGILSVISAGEFNNNVSTRDQCYAITLTAVIDYTSPTIITDDSHLYIYRPIIASLSDWELQEIAPTVYELTCYTSQEGEEGVEESVWAPIGYYFLVINYQYQFGNTTYYAQQTIPAQNFLTYKAALPFDYAVFRINLPDAATLYTPEGGEPVTVDTDATQMVLVSRENRAKNYQ